MKMKKNKIESVSIILPCVGHGTRLKFPYPKELIRVNEDMSVIDYSFQHILESHISPRVIVIIEPDKLDVIRYLYEKYNDKVDLVFVFQKNNNKEIIGTVRSVEHLLGDKNILLLPNTIIKYKDKKVALMDKILGSLNRHPFVFVNKNETSVTRLKLFGALNIQDGKVIDYEYKPVKNIKNYNAFWVSFGFKKEVFREVTSVIEQSILKKTNFKNVFKKSVIYKSPVIEVDSFTNIDTWTQLNAYLVRQYLEKSGIDPQIFKTN